VAAETVVLPPALPVYALARTRTATPFGTTPSRWRVYQFHHQGLQTARAARHVGTALTNKAGLTGIEPATSGVTDRHSNQLSYSPSLPPCEGPET
jgi:hypothetical protein